MRLLLDKTIFRKGSAFILSGVLRQNECWKIPKGPPLSFFSELWDFNFFIKGSPFNFLMICHRRDEKCQSFHLARQSGPTFGFLGCFRREYFNTLKSFCYFWALDMAPTWAVPGLFLETLLLNVINNSLGSLRKVHGSYFSQLRVTVWHYGFRSTVWNSHTPADNSIQFLQERNFSVWVLRMKSWHFFEIHFETPCIFRESFEFGKSISYSWFESLI